jgi:hypothetical protein
MPDDRDERLDPVVVVQESGPDPQRLLEDAVALPGDPLVLVDFQDVASGRLGAIVMVGQVGSQRVQPVEPGCRGDSFGVAVPTGLLALVAVRTAISPAACPVRIWATFASACLRVL